MVVDGVKLLELVKDNKFEDGDEIIPQITTNAIYVYSAYYRNFTDKKTGNQLTVQEYVFWTFDIPEKEGEMMDIQAIEEIGIYCKIIENTENEKVLFNMMQNNANKIDEILNAVKHLDKKIK